MDLENYPLCEVKLTYDNLLRDSAMSTKNSVLMQRKSPQTMDPRNKRAREKNMRNILVDEQLNNCLVVKAISTAMQQSNNKRLPEAQTTMRNCGNGLTKSVSRATGCTTALVADIDGMLKTHLCDLNKYRLVGQKSMQSMMQGLIKQRCDGISERNATAAQQEMKIKLETYLKQTTVCES